MKWWQRLQIVMTENKVSPEAIADATNIPVKSVYGYLKGVVENPRGDVIRKLAGAVGLDESELRYGEKVENIVQLKKIPLLDMNKLGTLRPDERALTAWDGVAMVSVPGVSVSESAFAVRLTDESGAPEFHANEIVICEPDTPATPGRMVIAAIHNQSMGVFRRFRPSSQFDHGKFTLVAPNPDYPQITVDADNPGHVIARATKHVRDI